MLTRRGQIVIDRASIAAPDTLGALNRVLLSLFGDHGELVTAVSRRRRRRAPTNESPAQRESTASPTGCPGVVDRLEIVDVHQYPRLPASRRLRWISVNTMIEARPIQQPRRASTSRRLEPCHFTVGPGDHGDRCRGGQGSQHQYRPAKRATSCLSVTVRRRPPPRRRSAAANDGCDTLRSSMRNRHFGVADKDRPA
jgi:hypothetical protein